MREGMRPTRRRVLLGGAALASSGLAGCTSGGETGGAGGASPTLDPTRTSTATHTESPSPTATGSATPTETATAPPAETSGFCGPLAGSPTPFDVSGMPYVFAFDYVDSWSVGEPIEQSNARYDRFHSPVLSGDDGESSATVRVGQSLEARTKTEVEAYIQEALDSNDESSVAYEEEFNGETVPFVELPNVDVSSYTTYLPYGDGEARYYVFSLVTYLENAGPGQNVGDCTDLVNAATETIRGSLSVNAETTIDSA